MEEREFFDERPDKKIIRGPLKIYDTAPALIGGLFADKHGKIVDYSRRVYELFFRRELAVDEVEAGLGQRLHKVRLGNRHCQSSPDAPVSVGDTSNQRHTSGRRGGPLVFRSRDWSRVATRRRCPGY